MFKNPVTATTKNQKSLKLECTQNLNSHKQQDMQAEGRNETRDAGYTAFFMIDITLLQKLSSKRVLSLTNGRLLEDLSANDFNASFGDGITSFHF